MISVGLLAREFKLLPSEVLSRASTYDIMIYDVLMTWDRYQQEKNSPGYIPNVKQETLEKILETSKNGR